MAHCSICGNMLEIQRISLIDVIENTVLGCYVTTWIMACYYGMSGTPQPSLFSVFHVFNFAINVSYSPFFYIRIWITYCAHPISNMRCPQLRMCTFESNIALNCHINNNGPLPFSMTPTLKFIPSRDFDLFLHVECTIRCTFPVYSRGGHSVIK